MALLNTHIGPEKIGEIISRAGSVYLIGIGGVSMSCLAEMSLALGLRVGGSDRTPSVITKHLEDCGIRVDYGHDASHVEGYGVVVFTLAIDAENPELLAAKEKGIPTISRADYLGYLMTGFASRIGVSGMHGKSTTTAMLAQIFSDAKRRPTVVSGASLSQSEGCYRAGDKDSFIYEACEYMDSFLCFCPTVQIILNVELDHTDYFADIDAVRHSFERALARLPQDGYAILNADDELTASLACHANQITFGIQNEASISASNIQSKGGYYAFDLMKRGEKLTRITLAIPGYHNIYNALAASAAALTMGVSPEDIRLALSVFRGASRRMEYHGSVGGVEIYEDYAHHPTEIRAALSAARDMKKGRLFCVFQSHTYSRTAELFDGFISALTLADHVLILPIYAARETDTRGVSGEKMALALKARGVNADNVDTFAAAADFLRASTRENDMVIVMGAGDVFHVLDELGVTE